MTNLINGSGISLAVLAKTSIKNEREGQFQTKFHSIFVGRLDEVSSHVVRSSDDNESKARVSGGGDGGCPSLGWPEPLM